MNKTTLFTLAIGIGILSGCTTVSTPYISPSHTTPAHTQTKTPKVAEFERQYKQLPSETRHLIEKHVPDEFIRLRLEQTNPQEVIKLIVEYAEYLEQGEIAYRKEQEAKRQAERDRYNQERKNLNKKVDCNLFQFDVFDLIPPVRALRFLKMADRVNEIEKARQRGDCK